MAWLVGEVVGGLAKSRGLRAGIFTILAFYKKVLARWRGNPDFSNETARVWSAPSWLGLKDFARCGPWGCSLRRVGGRPAGQCFSNVGLC